MKQEVLDYLSTQRVGVIAMETSDGTPHAATIHFANTNDPFVIFIETGRNSRKAEHLKEHESARASIVIGSNEKDPQTLQMDGIAQIIDESEKDLFIKTYLGKFAEKTSKLENPEIIGIKFTPTWWRFTDMRNPAEKLVLSSED